MIGNLSVDAYADTGYPFTGIYGSTIEAMNKRPVTATILNEPGFLIVAAAPMAGRTRAVTSAAIIRAVYSFYFAMAPFTSCMTILKWRFTVLFPPTPVVR